VTRDGRNFDMQSTSNLEELQQELLLLFDYNPPALVSDSSSVCPKLRPPPSFYEKHLDDRLTLKRIVLLPSITTRLSETVDKALCSIEHQKISLPYSTLDYFPTQRWRAATLFEDPIIDANSVARAYRRSTAIHCMIISSMLFLSPRASQWDKALNWSQSLARGLEDYRALEEDHTLRFLYMPGKSVPEFSVSSTIWNSMDNEIRERLPQVAQRFPDLAIWQIFAISEESEHFINDMGRVASLDDFRHEKCHTTWHKAAPTGNLSYAPDATSTSWGAPTATLSEVSSTLTPSSSLPLPEDERALPSLNRTLRRARVKVNPDSKPSKSEVTKNKRVSTRQQSVSHLTKDETWQSIVVAGRSSTADIGLTTSLLQHVSYVHLYRSTY
jgi:hypothetical protein